MAAYSKTIETLILLTLGWCLEIALAAETLGLSLEIGAFIAGVALARSPLAFFLSEQLRPFRDFFFVFFFFVLGTQLDPAAIRTLFLPGLLLTLLMMATKYISFRTLFRRVGEDKNFAHETGARLAQASEFSLLVVVNRFPSPLASNPKLKQD
jgi:Kef-type K+ transport system membrane component KefB